MPERSKKFATKSSVFFSRPQQKFYNAENICASNTYLKQNKTRFLTYSINQKQSNNLISKYMLSPQLQGLLYPCETKDPVAGELMKTSTSYEYTRSRGNAVKSQELRQKYRATWVKIQAWVDSGKANEHGRENIPIPDGQFTGSILILLLTSQTTQSEQTC